MIISGPVILIVINLSGTVVMQEFEDMDACVAASQIIKEETEAVTYCIPKASREE